jgi:hypothetical protein
MRSSLAVQYHSKQQHIFRICEVFLGLAGIASGMQGHSLQARQQQAQNAILEGAKHGYQET